MRGRYTAQCSVPEVRCRCGEWPGVIWRCTVPARVLVARVRVPGAARRGWTPPQSKGIPEGSTRLGARRGARAVESGGLENRWARKRPLGSNPSPAAVFRSTMRFARPAGDGLPVHHCPLASAVSRAHWRTIGEHCSSQLVRTSSSTGSRSRGRPQPGVQRQGEPLPQWRRGGTSGARTAPA